LGLCWLRKSKDDKPDPDDLIYDPDKPASCCYTGFNAMGLVATIYIILSACNFLFNILEALLINDYINADWFAGYMVLIGLEYYLLLLPALCYGFHGLEWKDTKALLAGSDVDHPDGKHMQPISTGAHLLGILTVVALPVTTAFSIVLSGFSVALRAARATTTSVGLGDGMLGWSVALVLALLLLPGAVALACLLPVLWAASIGFSLYWLTPYLYLLLERLFAWCVIDAVAFRFDHLWLGQERDRAAKVHTLFHPGTPAEDAANKLGKAGASLGLGISARDMATLLAYAVLVRFFVSGLAHICYDIAHEESGSNWEGWYMPLRFTWTVLVFLYDLYMLLQMIKAGGLFNPGAFLGEADATQFAQKAAQYSSPQELDMAAQPPLFVNPVFENEAVDLPEIQQPMSDLDYWKVKDVGTKVTVDGYDAWEGTLQFCGYDHNGHAKVGVVFPAPIGSIAGVLWKTDQATPQAVR